MAPAALHSQHPQLRAPWASPRPEAAAAPQGRAPCPSVSRCSGLCDGDDIRVQLRQATPPGECASTSSPRQNRTVRSVDVVLSSRPPRGALLSPSDGGGSHVLRAWSGEHHAAGGASCQALTSRPRQLRPPVPSTAPRRYPAVPRPTHTSFRLLWRLALSLTGCWPCWQPRAWSTKRPLPPPWPSRAATATSSRPQVRRTARKAPLVVGNTVLGSAAWSGRAGGAAGGGLTPLSTLRRPRLCCADPHGSTSPAVLPQCSRSASPATRCVWLRSASGGGKAPPQYGPSRFGSPPPRRRRLCSDAV